MVSFQTIGDMSSNTYKPIVIISSTFSCLCSPTIVKSIYTESKNNKDRVVLREWGSGEIAGVSPRSLLLPTLTDTCSWRWSLASIPQCSI